MNKKENKIDFDLSVLNHKELIDLYYKVDEFIDFLETEENKINEQDKEKDNE